MRETVQRLLLAVDGTFARSPGLRLVDDITDDLLIEIRKAVISAGNAAQPKPLSGLAQQKVMLWVVVDAVRSPVVLTGADLSRAAGRIWKQAARVSEALSVTAKEHASRRDAARAAAAADPGLAAGLSMLLAAIGGKEEAWCDKLRREVYEGLDVVLELAAVPAPAPHVDTPKPPDTVLTSPDTAIPAPTTSTGVRFPWLIPPTEERMETPPLPADLVASLEPDGLQRLFNGYKDSMEGKDPGEWWSYLPDLVNRLNRELALAYAARESREAQHQDELRWWRATTASEPAVDHRDEVIREGETEIVVLAIELA